MRPFTRFVAPLVLGGAVYALPQEGDPVGRDATTTITEVPGIAPPGMQLEPGYLLARVVDGLDFPSSVTIARDVAWIAEAGGIGGLQPAVRQVVLRDGIDVSVLLRASDLPDGVLEAPLTSIAQHDGRLWITHRQVGANGWLVGAISSFSPLDPVGTFETRVTDLPAAGDHAVGGLTFSRDGRAWFGMGTATNSGVVGPDNEVWVGAAPDFHDFAPRDLVLAPAGFGTVSPFPLDPTAIEVTPPFGAFGDGLVPGGTVVTAPSPDAPIEGMIAGNGAVYSFDARAADAAATLRLEAWGLRNPTGLRFDPFDADALFVTNHGAEIRTAQLLGGDFAVNEARPIANDADDLFLVRVGPKPGEPVRPLEPARAAEVADTDAVGEDHALARLTPAADADGGEPLDPGRAPEAADASGAGEDHALAGLSTVERPDPAAPVDPFGPDLPTADGGASVATPAPPSPASERPQLGAPFFGWPDFFHDPVTRAPMAVTASLFCEGPDELVLTCPGSLLDPDFAATLRVESAFAQLDHHGAAGRLDLSSDAGFGFVGDLFVAQAGRFVTYSGVPPFAGHRVARVDRSTGEATDFLVNAGTTADELYADGKLRKPVDVRFQGELLFVLDQGVLEPGLGLAEPGTGGLWVVARVAP